MMKQSSAFFCTFFLLLISYVYSLDNGLGLTPAMGYNTWNDFRCNINAQDIKKAAESIVKYGLDKVGYQYVNIDDCWAKSRDSNGVIVPDNTTFPDGIKPIADYVHSLGLKFGIYTDRGTETCQKRPGSKGYEKIDAQTYASWGVDYLKEDSCAATQDHSKAFEEYALMRDALNATGRPIYFSLCGWNPWYSPPGFSLGNSWRISGDCNTWKNVLTAINTNAPLSFNARPGGWNDPDMLLGSSPGTAAYLTQIQSRTMFSMWSIMAAPLLIGSRITDLPQFDLETYSNTEVIAVDQDPLGIQGIRVQGEDLETDGGGSNIWAKPLQGGHRAVIFLNNFGFTTDMICDGNCFQNMGWGPDVIFVARDLWAHQDLPGNFTAKNFVVKNLEPSGGSRIFKFTQVY